MCFSGEGIPRDVTKLDFRHSAITALPAWVAECTSLESLVLGGTKKIVEPPDVSTLASLERLFLSDTKFVEPPDVSTLVNLRYLYLGGCDQLRALPDVSANKNLDRFDKPGHLK